MADKKKLFGLENAVRNEAIATSFENALHHDVCVKLVELADTFNSRNEMGHFCPNGFTHTKKGEQKPFPMGALVYFAVNKEAHRQPSFEKGYKMIHEDKAKAILKMLKFWGTYNGNTNLSRCDKVVHAITKYYERVSPKMKDFKSDVEKYWKPYPKTPNTMKEITIGLHIDVE